jgi:hypothetical protein
MVDLIIRDVPGYESVTEQHLEALAQLLPDLADKEIMRGAWK